MTDKSKILIISDSVHDTSKALQRALSALFEAQYLFDCATYSEIELQIRSELPRSVLDTQLNKSIDKLNNKFDALRESLAHCLEQESMKDNKAAEEEYFSALISLENDVTQYRERIKSYKSGGIIQTKFQEGIRKKIDNKPEEEKKLEQRFQARQAASLHNKEIVIVEFRKRAFSLIQDLRNLVNGLPADTHPALLEDLWQDIISEWDKKLDGLTEYRDDSLKIPNSEWDTISLMDLKRDAVGNMFKELSLIIIVNLNTQHNHEGIRFLRRYWAEIVKHDQAPPPVAFLSNYSIQELMRMDTRYFVLLAEGAEVFSIPFSIGVIQKHIRHLADRPFSKNEAKTYLKKSADLAAEGIINHAWLNFAAPYSLLRGAYYAKDIAGFDYRTLLAKLQKRDNAAYEEAYIYDAIAEVEIPVRVSGSEDAKEVSLSQYLRGKRVLLIDDEAATSGLKDTLDVICGQTVLTLIDGQWENSDELFCDRRIADLLASTIELETYDLILLDLYLTKEDEKIKKRHPHGRPPLGITFGGISLLRELAKNEDFTVPVIMFTATTRFFNVKDAEKDIEGYIQKRACYQDKNEAIGYYQEFKSHIEEATSQDRTLLRNIWQCIREYNNKPSRSDDAVKYLEYAFFALKSYLREESYTYLIGTVVMIGSAIELLWDKKNHNYLYYPPTMQRRAASIHQKYIYAFMALQIRGSAAHPKKAVITLDDAFFAFFSLFKALDIDTPFIALDPCTNWPFSADHADSMIKSICKYSCPGTKGFCTFIPDGGDKCTAKGTNSYIQAALLSLGHNLQQPESSLNQMFFKYLFFMLAFKDNAPTDSLPPLFLHLVKNRLTYRGKFCEPIKSDCWVGMSRVDGYIESSLGTLEPGMYTIVKTDGDKVHFHPTEGYLRG